MNTIFTILAILIVIAAVLLVLVVLLQNGKGDSLVTNFTAGNQTLGVRQTADILEKVTWFLVAFILVVSIISSFTLGSRGTQVDVSSQIENAVEQPSFPSAQLPAVNPEATLDAAAEDASAE